MNKQIKSLSIHNNTQDDKTTAIVIEEKDFLQKAKEFLKRISDNSQRGIVLCLEGNNKGCTVAYARDNFVIVAPDGTRQSAKLYGNWDEALVYAQKILSNQDKKSRITLEQYFKNQ